MKKENFGLMRSQRGYSSHATYLLQDFCPLQAFSTILLLRFLNDDGCENERAKKRVLCGQARWRSALRYVSRASLTQYHQSFSQRVCATEKIQNVGTVTFLFRVVQVSPCKESQRKSQKNLRFKETNKYKVGFPEAVTY